MLLMLEKLDQIEARYEALTAQLASPEVLTDSARYQKTAKAHAELVEVVSRYREFQQVEADLQATRLLLAENDPDLRQLASEELARLEKHRRELEAELKRLLLPRDPNDEKNVVLEIRAGTGGDEASLFAAEMLRLYLRYAEAQGWRAEMLSTSE